MEKQLVEKMSRHELDDVDKAMILARLKSTHSQIEDILNELNKSFNKLSDLSSDKKEEMALLKFRLIFACDDMIIHDSDDSSNDGVPCLCTFGTRTDIKGLLSTAQKAIDS